jgi:tetratricopeptide (TPR) repeat protein
MFQDKYFWDQLAIQSYKSLIKKTPDAAFLHQNLALAYVRINKENKAIRSLQRAIKINKNNPDAYYHLGTLYYKEEKFKQAATCFKHYNKLMKLKKQPLCPIVESTIQSIEDEIKSTKL